MLIPYSATFLGLRGPEWASIIVAVVAAGAAWSSQRQASKASSKDTVETSRADIEKDAFTRAQSFLDGTIQRQDSEIADLRTEVDGLRVENKKLREDHDRCDRKIADQATTIAQHERKIADQERVIVRLTRQGEQLDQMRARIRELEQKGTMGS